MFGKIIDRVLIGAIGVVLVLMVVFGIRHANAAGTTANLSWTHPTTYIDGTPLALADIGSTVITWRRTATGPVVATLTVPAPATTAAVQGLVCGNFVFTARTVMRVSADSSDETAPPAPYSTGITCRANPPTGLQAS